MTPQSPTVHTALPAPDETCSALTLRLPLPPSVNHYKSIGDNGFPYRNKVYRQWCKEAGWMVRLQIQQASHRIFDGDLVVEISFDRRGDIDNRIKPLLDLLQEMRVYKNDAQVVEIHARFAQISGCIVTLSPTEAR